MIRRGRSLPQAVLATTVLVCFVILSGCGDVHVRRAYLKNGLSDLHERFAAGRRWEVGSASVLQRQGLAEVASDDPSRAASILEAKLQGSPAPGGALTLAGLHYRAGLAVTGHEPAVALGHFRDAAVLAGVALEEVGGTSGEEAITLHNRATARMIELSQDRRVSQGRSWRDVLASVGVQLATSPAAFTMRPERFESVTPTERLKVVRMQHSYQTWGLGVPVVAVRRVDPNSAESQERYFPREYHIGATAALAPGGGLAGGTWRSVPASLVFHDAIEDRSLRVGGRNLPIATDKTTPLVSQVDGSAMASLELVGLLRSDFQREGEADTGGIYMREPYRPGKIPVVLVHGLISSPRAWIQTLNELSHDPYLSQYYQFWVFVYPTGLPIPTNAKLLRDALYKARATFDPTGHDAAFDKMVVVGHSMGGILTKMMIQDTGLTLWDATIQVPHDRFQAPPDLLAEINSRLIFKPVPFVSRIVCIAAPHRGSPVADEVVGRTVASLIRGPENQAQMIEELERLNGKDMIAPQLKARRSLNSVNNLSRKCPILRALDKIPTAPGVPYHTIAYFLGGQIPFDLLVPYDSAHLEGAASEAIFSGTHVSQQSLETSNEVRRILIEHVGGLTAHRSTPPPRPLEAP